MEIIVARFARFDQKQDFFAVFVKESKHEPKFKTFSRNGM